LHFFSEYSVVLRANRTANESYCNQTYQFLRFLLRGSSGRMSGSHHTDVTGSQAGIANKSRNFAEEPLIKSQQHAHEKKPANWPVFRIRKALPGSVVAAATAVAATTTTAAVTTAAATGTWLHRTRFVHDHVATVNRLAVHAADRCLRFCIAGHFDKAEAFGTAAVAVGHDFGRLDLTEGAEGVLQRVVGHRVGEVANVKFLAHERTFQKSPSTIHSISGTGRRCPAALAAWTSEVARGGKPRADGLGRIMPKNDSALAQVAGWVGREEEDRSRIAMGAAGVRTGEKGTIGHGDVPTRASPNHVGQRLPKKKTFLVTLLF
jgi:hypothetical protein